MTFEDGGGAFPLERNERSNTGGQTIAIFEEVKTPTRGKNK